MIEIIKLLPESTFKTPEQVNPRFFYGVLVGRSSKGFIARSRTDGDFIVHCADNLTNGNYWDSFVRSQLQTCVADMLNNGNFKVYEFATSQELFAWLAN